MNRHVPGRRAIRPARDRNTTRRAALLAVILAMTVGVLTVAPATTAMAAPIAGCTISPELQPSATMEGISCVGDDGTGSGLLAPTRQVGSCNFAVNTDQLPIGMLGFLTDRVYSYTIDDATRRGPLADDGAYRIQTSYVNTKGRITGRVTYVTHAAGWFTLQIDSYINPGARQSAFLNCMESKSGFAMNYDDATPFYVPSATATPAPITGGTGPSIPPGAIQTTGSVTALPGHPGQYIGRVNVVNNSTTSALDADVFFDESTYSLDEFFMLPSDAECGYAGSANAYHCDFPSIDPGATRTVVVHLIARAGADTTQPLAVSIINPGAVKYPIFDGAPAIYHDAILQNDYLFEMPH